MKKTLSLLFALLAFTLPASAYDFMVGGLCYNINNAGNTVSVTYQNQPYFSYYNPSYYNLSGALTIPPSVTYDGTTYSVTSIGNDAFSFCSHLTSVVIPNSVTFIGDEAFRSCSGLTSVTIPNSVTSISYKAFDYCIGLTSVTIPNSVTTLGSSAFSSCYGLTSVNIGNSVTSIGDEAFRACTGLTSVTIPNSVTSIGSGAFELCSGIKSLTWNAVNCPSNGNMPTSNIEQVTIGNNVKVLPTNFASASKITSVTIPNSVKTIGESAFNGCTGLTSVTIPNSVITIGNAAFADCSNLTGKLVIPNSVNSVGIEAFKGPNFINPLVIGESVADIGSKAFSIPSLTDIAVMRPRPIVIPNDTFEGVSMVGCDLHVMPGSKVRYEMQDVWKDFYFIDENAEQYGQSGGTPTGVLGDVNGDGIVTSVDVTIIYNILLGNN